MKSRRCCAPLSHASQQQLTTQQQRRPTCWPSAASWWRSCAAWQCYWRQMLVVHLLVVHLQGAAAAWEAQRAAVAGRCAQLASWGCAQVRLLASFHKMMVPACFGMSFNTRTFLAAWC